MNYLTAHSFYLSCSKIHFKNITSYANFHVQNISALAFLLKFEIERIALTSLLVVVVTVCLFFLPIGSVCHCSLMLKLKVTRCVLATYLWSLTLNNEDFDSLLARLNKPCFSLNSLRKKSKVKEKFKVAHV